MMRSISDGARCLPPHHVTIRVPWHGPGLDRDGVCPAAGQLELPYPAPHWRGPARRGGSALRWPAARRTRPGRPATLRGRARLIHGSFRSHTEDDAPLHRDLPSDPRPFGTHPLCTAEVLRRLRALQMDASRECRGETARWRDRNRRAPEDPLGAGTANQKYTITKASGSRRPGSRSARTSSPCSTPSSACSGQRSRSASSMPSAHRSPSSPDA